jgi:hypothetical protein
MPCSTCGQPDRALWTYGSLPPLEHVESGNYLSLQRCAECAAYWCAGLYEPYAAFRFATLWPHDAQTWRRIHDLDDGQSLREWHGAVLRETWQSAPAEARADIEAWRKRTSYGHNPIDQGPSYSPPRRIRKADDLKKLAKSG